MPLRMFVPPLGFAPGGRDRAVPGAVWPRTSAVPEQQGADLLGLAEERAELRQRGVHRPGELLRAAEALERLRRNELEEDIAAARRQADEVHREDVVVLEEQHAERRAGLEGDDGGPLDPAPLHRD